MLKRKNWDKEKSVILDMAVIAAVISVVVLVAYQVNGIYPFGDGTVARGDMVQQTIPAGMYYVWDILHGDASPFFTWNSAFGINISGASSLGALLSPLNLFLYFTTRANIVNFVNILLILKMIAIACAMYVYLRKYEIRNTAQIAGGILYAFGAASLIHFQIIFVMDAAFLLPLIMIGVDRIINKKGCKFFIFFLALSMIVNVYSGCMTLIFIFLSCGAKIFLDMEDRQEKKRCALWLGISVGLAVLLSAVVSIPAFLCIANTSRSGDGDLLNTYMTVLQSHWGLGEWKTVERMLVNIALPCAGIMFFRQKVKQHKGHSFLVILMILSVLVSGTELLWHGGTRAFWPIRFVYVISFVFIDFAMALYEEQKERVQGIGKWLNDKVVFVIAAVAAVVSGGIFYGIYETYCEKGTYSELGDGFLVIFIELICFALYGCLLKAGKKELVMVLLCVEMTCTSVISFAPNKDNVTVFSPDYLEAASEVATSMETEIGEFERIKNTDYKVDHIEYSLVLGKEAISNYWHVIPQELQSRFAALGYSINWTQLLDTGGTAFSDTLLQNKYFLSQSELPETLYEYCEDVDGYGDDVLHLYKNKFELPFAVTMDTPSLVAGEDKFQTQNALFAAVTGSQESLIQNVSQQIYSNRFDLDVGSEKKILYFYGTNGSDHPVNITVNGSPVIIPSSSSTTNRDYPADFGNGIICLGCFENEHVTVQFSGEASASSLRLGVMDYNVFVNGTEQVKKQNPEIRSLEQRNSGLDIEIANVTKPYVFLPVSYDEGWECTVNGETVSKVEDFGGMLSVPVVQGDNEISLRYRADGRQTGAVISLLTLLVIVAFVVVSMKKGIHAEKLEGILSCVAYMVFAVLFVAVVVILFVIPLMYYLRRVWVGTE